MTTIEFCDKYGPCYSGESFALQFERMSEVWENCKMSDWLFWILKKHAPLKKDQSARLTIVFAESALKNFKNINDESSSKATQGVKSLLKNPRVYTSWEAKSFLKEEVAAAEAAEAAASGSAEAAAAEAAADSAEDSAAWLATGSVSWLVAEAASWRASWLEAEAVPVEAEAAEAVRSAKSAAAEAVRSAAAAKSAARLAAKSKAEAASWLEAVSAAEAAWLAEKAEQCNQIRRLIPNPFE